MLASTRDKAILEGVCWDILQFSHFPSSQVPWATRHTVAAVGTQWLESQSVVGALWWDAAPTFSQSRSAHPQLRSSWWELQPKRTVVKRGKTHYVHLLRQAPRAKQKRWRWLVCGDRVALTGMAVANTAEARATTTLRLHGTHS